MALSELLSYVRATQARTDAYPSRTGVAITEPGIKRGLTQPVL
jgi:hypothetical protein